MKLRAQGLVTTSDTGDFSKVLVWYYMPRLLDGAQPKVLPSRMENHFWELGSSCYRDYLEVMGGYMCQHPPPPLSIPAPPVACGLGLVLLSNLRFREGPPVLSCGLN